jgi:hypothetical protein
MLMRAQSLAPAQHSRIAPMDAFGAEAERQCVRVTIFSLVSNPFDFGCFGGEALLALYNIQDFDVGASSIILMLVIGRHIPVMMLYIDAFPG